MNYEVLTIDDCLKAYEFNGWEAIIENGQVVSFLIPDKENTK